MLPDLEFVLTTWIRGTFSVDARTDLPADLAGALPVVQVGSVGGGGTRFDGSPRIDIDVYAADYAAARDMAASIHDALILLRGTVGGAVIRDVRVDALPTRRPYDNTSLRRVGSSYTVTARPNSYV